MPADVARLLDETADGKVGIVVGEHGGAQSATGNLAPDLIPPEALLALADVVGRGSRRYASNNWRRIPMHEQLRHALIHIFKYMAGDRSEKHLWNALTRLAFAVAVEVDYDFREYKPLPEKTFAGTLLLTKDAHVPKAAPKRAVKKSAATRRR